MRIRMSEFFRWIDHHVNDIKYKDMVSCNCQTKIGAW